MTDDVEEAYRFFVSSAVLSRHSGYFRRMLGSDGPVAREVQDTISAGQIRPSLKVPNVDPWTLRVLCRLAHDLQPLFARFITIHELIRLVETAARLDCLPIIREELLHEERIKEYFAERTLIFAAKLQPRGILSVAYILNDLQMFEMITMYIVLEYDKRISARELIGKDLGPGDKQHEVVLSKSIPCY